MLHDGRDKGIAAVRNGVGLGLDGRFEIPVDQDGALGGYIHRSGQVALEHLLVHDDFHGPPPKDVGRPHNQGVTFSFERIGTLEAERSVSDQRLVSVPRARPEPVAQPIRRRLVPD
ncbi:MAG: hypothetical protein R6T83_12355, partial [Salinibacter sp.]